MNKIEDYVNKKCNRVFCFSLIIFVVLSVIAFFVNNCINSKLNDQPELVKFLVDIVVGVFSPTTATIFFYRCHCKYFREKKWKTAFPELDLAGEWVDLSTYKGYIDSNGIHSMSQPASKPSQVIIEQTYNTIKIRFSNGKDFTWYSISATLDNEGKLDILYKVEYKQEATSEGYPEDNYGYECMKPEIHIGQKSPKMTGKFRQCVKETGNKIYWGEVTYTRQL